MEEKVGYAGEAPSLPSWAETDWRLQEMLSMGPQAVMDELLGLSEEIHDSRLLHEEVKFELRQAQERLKLMEAQALQAALDSDDSAVKGKNAEERKRKADIFLADHPTVKQLAFEIVPLENLESTARLAMEALLDRSKNLHQWARMFEAQVRLLSTVRMPEEGKTVTVKGGGLTIVGVPVGEVAEVKARLAELDGVPVTVEREPVESKPEEVAHILAKAYREPILEDEVLDAMEAGGIKVPVSTFDGFVEDAAGVEVIYELAKKPLSELPPATHDPHGMRDLYMHARKWVEWEKNLVGAPAVDTVWLVNRIVEIPVETSYIGEEPEPDGARFVSEVDELFPPEVEIPPSLGVSEEEADDMKAAMDRYLPGKKADESLGPSL